MKNTRFLMIACVLAIISSCFAFLEGFGHWLNYSHYFSSWPGNYDMIFNWLFAICVFGFAFGLAASILVLLKQHFVFTTIGMVILLFTHLLSTVLPIYKYPTYFLAAGLLFGTPPLIASALSLVLTIANKDAFT